MSAFFTATISGIKNEAKFQEYSKSAAATFAPYGGELVLRGRFAKALAGSSDAKMAAVVRFPDLDALNGWYNSTDYQALVPLRDEAADMAITAFDVPA